MTYTILLVIVQKVYLQASTMNTNNFAYEEVDIMTHPQQSKSQNQPMEKLVQLYLVTYTHLHHNSNSEFLSMTFANMIFNNNNLHHKSINRRKFSNSLNNSHNNHKFSNKSNYHRNNNNNLNLKYNKVNKICKFCKITQKI